MTPAMLFALLPPVMTVPNASYSEGLLATVGLLSLLVFCGLFVLLRDAWFDLIAPTFGPSCAPLQSDGPRSAEP